MVSTDESKNSRSEPETEKNEVSKEEAKRTRLFVAICYATCCFIWGTTWYAVRVSVEPGDGYPPIFAGALRFLVALFLYMPILAIFHRKLGSITKSELFWISLSGLFNGVYQCFIYSAETTISGGLASVIMATAPLMVATAATVFGMEKVRKNTVIGFLVSLAGIGLVCLDRVQTANEQVTGIVLTVVAAFFTSLSNVTLKGRGTRVHPLLSATVFLVATDIPVWLASFLTGEKPWLAMTKLLPFGEPALAVFYMAVMSSIIAFLLYLYMLRHMSLMGISTLQFIIPILALIVDMFLEQRVALNMQVWVGIAVVMGGVAFSMKRH